MTRRTKLPAHPGLLDRLTSRRLVAVTGKGGVGKTTLAAALARVLASRGRRILLVEMDPRENLHQLLDVPPSGGAVIKVGARLWLENVQPVRVLEDLVRDPEQVAVVIATTAEEMPVQEALELIAGLRERLGRPPELLVVNGLYPPFPQQAGRVAVGGKTALTLWRQRREVNERELERLASAWPGPRVDLPLLALERGPALAAALGERLVRALQPAEVQ